MKVWTMIIIALRPKIRQLCEMVEGEIMKLATDICLDTMETIYQIEELNRKKIKFINLKILSDRIRTAVGDDYKLLYQYSFGKSLSSLAQDNKISRCKMLRVLDKLFAVAEEILHTYGFNVVRLEKEYKSIEIIGRLYVKINKSIKSSNRPRGEACALSAVV